MIGTVLYLFTQRKKNASAKQLVFFFLCLFLFFFFSLLPSVQRHRFPHNCIPLPAIRSLLVLLKVTNQLFGIVFLECFPILFFFVNSSPPPLSFPLLLLLSSKEGKRTFLKLCVNLLSAVRQGPVCLTRHGPEQDTVIFPDRLGGGSTCTTILSSFCVSEAGQYILEPR